MNQSFKEILDMLKSHEFDFKVNELGCIRAKAGNKKSFCPITALCYKKTKKRYAVGDARLVAMRANIDTYTAYIIIAAADNLKILGKQLKLRKAMIEAIG